MLRGRRILIVAGGLLALLLATLLPSLFEGGSESGPGISDAPPTGRVLSADGSPPPPGTRVTARGPSGVSETRTGEDGSFTFPDLPEDVTEFEAIAGPLRVKLSAGGDTASGETPRLVLPERFDVAGRVVAGDSGEAAPDAEVRCGGRTTRTDARGRFTLQGIRAPAGGLPAVEVRCKGHAPVVFVPPADAAWDDLYVRLTR